MLRVEEELTGKLISSPSTLSPMTCGTQECRQVYGRKGRPRMPCLTVDLAPHLAGKLQIVLGHQQEAAVSGLCLLLQLQGDRQSQDEQAGLLSSLPGFFRIVDKKRRWGVPI